MKIGKGNAEAEILLRGGYLYSFTVNGKDVILRGNLYKPTRGGMALLIPYTNRVKDGEYEFDGIKYSLPKNKEGNAIHGLVLNEAFEVVDKKDDSLTLQYLLKHDGYPSTLLSRVNYKIDENALSIKISITNTGERRAPLTVGTHPYFVISDDWEILTTTDVKQCVMKDKIPTGELVISKFEHRDYDDCFLVNGNVKLKSSYSSILIKRENMPFIQVYTGVKGALAIEPMSGAPDAYHNGLGLKVLNSKEEAHFSFQIFVERI
ncbi:aldose 1-epimerase [Sulfolobus sp. S-194]|uniref:aldose 1-epimerase n=1 Tax=Sulfolobus sp. S-194 TaxID=2512240 RepID=UPI001436F169|nr:aldose 1-epimerase [Sulfolobus sp. S-194]QIW23985.1 aldose 1-epimerase [Sulfolobus sp. S-194]